MQAVSKQGGLWHKTGARQKTWLERAVPICCVTSRPTGKRGGVHHCEVSRHPVYLVRWSLHPHCSGYSSRAMERLLVAQWHENWGTARFPGP